MAGTVHVTPVGDDVEHDTSTYEPDCACGPEVRPVQRPDGSTGWLIVHASLDGREQTEHPSNPRPSDGGLSPEEGHVKSTSELTGEPALYASLVASAVQLAAAFWLPWTDVQVAVVNAVVVAVAGVWVAFATRSIDNGGSIKAAILGLGQAGISLAVTFGWDASTEQTAGLMTFVGLVVAVFVRQTSRPKSAYDLAA